MHKIFNPSVCNKRNQKQAQEIFEKNKISIDVNRRFSETAYYERRKDSQYQTSNNN